MPYCPNCRYEYVDGIEMCSDCDIELVSALVTEQAAEPSSKPKIIEDEFVPVFASQDAVEIDIVEGILVGSGIPTLRKSDVMRSIYPKMYVSGRMGQTFLTVPASRAEEAREVIEESLASGKE